MVFKLYIHIFSTFQVELVAEKIVCPSVTLSVRHIVFREIGWMDFDEILHEDVEFNSKNNYRARFSIPDTVPDRWPKKCHF